MEFVCLALAASTFMRNNYVGYDGMHCNVKERSAEGPKGYLSEPTCTRTSSSTSQQRSVTSWTPPEANGIKVNYDGATFAAENKAGLGVAIRDGDGQLVASLTQRTPLPSSVIEVEAMAARWTLEFALELGFDNITLEGDSKVLIQALKTKHQTLAQYGHLVADIQFLISRFSCVKLSVVRRHCNKLAHSLARRATIISHMTVWMDKLPPELHNVLLADLKSLP